MIPPGGEGQIKVTLKPKGKRIEISKDVVVISNDPEQPRFTLTMKGTLLVDMMAHPLSVPLVNLAPGEAGTETFSLERSEGSTATVTSVRVEDPKRFSIREIEAEPEALATYEVRFKGGDIGITTTNVIIETTGENTPRLKVPVRASVSYNLRYPKRVALVRRGDGPYEQTLRISTRRGDPPKIKKVEDPDGLLDIEVLAPDGPTVGIHLRVRDNETNQLDEKSLHKLLVHTSDRDEPKLELAYNLKTAPTPNRARTVPR